MARFSFRELSEISITGAGTYYFLAQNPGSQEKLGIQYQIENASSLVGTVGIDLRADPTAAWMPFAISGTVYASTIVTATVAITGSVGKLTFLSKSASTPGNEIVVKLVNTATAGAETVSVATNSTTEITTITVGIQTGVSTAAQIKTALDANPTAFALIGTTVTIGGAMEIATAQLAGGGAFIDLETAAPWIRVRANITSGTATLRCFFGAKS